MKLIKDIIIFISVIVLSLAIAAIGTILIGTIFTIFFNVDISVYFGKIGATVVVIIFVIFLINKKQKNDIQNTSPPRIKTSITILGIIALVYISLHIFIHSLARIVHIGDIGKNQMFSTDEILPIEFMVILLATCVFTPIYEELLFRKYGLLQLKKMNTIGIVLIMAVSFSIIHLPSSWDVWLSTLFGGLSLSYIYVKTRNIIYSIVGHGFYNLTSIVLDQISYHKLLPHDGQFYIFPTWIVILASIIFIGSNIALFFVLFRKNKTIRNKISMPEF